MVPAHRGGGGGEGMRWILIQEAWLKVCTLPSHPGRQRFAGRSVEKPQGLRSPHFSRCHVQAPGQASVCSLETTYYGFLFPSEAGR